MKTITTRTLTDGITVYEFTQEVRKSGQKVWTLTHWDSQDNLLNECTMNKTKLTHVWQSLKLLGFTELVEPDTTVVSEHKLTNGGISYEFLVYKNSVLISKLQKHDINTPGNTIYKGLVGPGTCKLTGWYTPEYARRCYKSLLKKDYDVAQ